MSAYNCLPPRVNELIEYNDKGDIALVYSATRDVFGNLQVVLITNYGFLLRGSYSYVRGALFVDEHSKFNIFDLGDIILQKYKDKQNNK